MINCPNCDSSINDDTLNFCPSCERQVRCLNKECRAMLKPNNSICLTCGETVKNRGDSATFNTLTIDTTQDGNSFSQKIAVKATDASVGHMSGIAMQLINVNKGTGTIQRQINAPIGNRSGLPANTVEAQVKNSNDNQVRQIHEDIEAQNQERVQIDDTVLMDAVEEFFRLDETNNLVLLDAFRKRDFGDGKKTKSGKATNIVLFYIFACEHFRITAPTREQIFNMLEKEKLLNSNSRFFFDKTIVSEYLSKEQNGYKLHYAGKEKLLLILSEIYNPTPHSSIKRVNKSKSSRKNTSTAKINPTIQSWIEKTIDIDKLGTSAIKSVSDWALFVVYLLTKHLNLVETIKPGDAYVYITTLKTATSLDRKQFRDSISRNKKLFDKNAKGEYFLTQAGIEKAKTDFFEASL